MDRRAIIATLALSAALGGCGGVDERPLPHAVVPNLIGMNAVEAQSLLARRGLLWRWEDGAKPTPANGFLLPDTIVAQAPAVGARVVPGTEVLLVPSSVKIVNRGT